MLHMGFNEMYVISLIMHVSDIKINTSQMLVNFTCISTFFKKVFLNRSDCISIIDLQTTYIVKLVQEKYNIKNTVGCLWVYGFLGSQSYTPVTGEEFRVNEFV